MRTLSTSFLRAIHAQESAEVFLPLLKLSHADWDDDLRIVPNGEAVTHGGEEYQPWAFEVTLPDDADEGLPVLRWQADGINQELVIRLRSVMGAISARVVWVLASQPDMVEAGPFDLEITAADYDAFSVSGVMSIEPILDEQFGFLTMTPKTTPGLF